MSVIDEIAAERRRQVEEEGFTAEHDDCHPGEMARAAAAYAEVAASSTPYENGAWPPINGKTYRVATPERWPWDLRWWKPKNRRRDLVRAAALIVAEIERLDRARNP